jgi:hypothetical protein
MIVTMILPMLKRMLCFFSKIKKKLKRIPIAAIPISIMILQGRANSRKIWGKKISEIRPRVMMAKVYIVRFKIRETVTTTVEMPFLCIK